jgi:hypothetical protein
MTSWLSQEALGEQSGRLTVNQVDILQARLLEAEEITKLLFHPLDLLGSFFFEE